MQTITPVLVVYQPHGAVIDVSPMLDMIFHRFEGPEMLEERIINLIEDVVSSDSEKFSNDLSDHAYLLFELRKVFNQLKKSYHVQKA